MIIWMTIVGMNLEQWHIIYNAPLLLQLVRVQEEVMLHFLDKENLVEKQDVSLVAVGAIVCNGHIGQHI